MSQCTPEVSAFTPQPTEMKHSNQGQASAFALVDQLLRDRGGLLARIEGGDNLAGFARTMIVTIVVSSVVFGASLGLLRGGVQIAFSGLKMPLVILLTAAICTPVLSALRHVIVGHTDIRRDSALVLASLALGSLVIAALAPLVMLAVGYDVGYHTLILIAVGCCAIGGSVGFFFFIRGSQELSAGSRTLIVGITLLMVGLVGSQMAWTFRPYLVRPRTEEVPIIRAVEGSFLDSIATSVPSALGIYSRETAPLGD